MSISNKCAFSNMDRKQIYSNFTYGDTCFMFYEKKVFYHMTEGGGILFKNLKHTFMYAV